MPTKTTQIQFVEKANIVHNNKYDYSKISFNKMSDVLDIICPIHGSFSQRAYVHINDKCGCPQCGKLRQGARITDFVNRAKAVHGDKYDYSLAKYKDAHTDVKILCPLHGEFLQRPDAHIHQKQGCRTCGYLNRINPAQEKFVGKVQSCWNYDFTNTKYVNKETKVTYVCPKHGLIEQKPYLLLRSGCPYCNGRGISKHTPQTFISIANKIHENYYDYSLVSLNRITDYVDIICPKHGIFTQRANNHIHLGNGCPKCVSHSSEPEKEVLDFVRENYSGLILTHDKKVLDGKEIDIYLPELGLGIEYHGMYWHLETSVGRKYHELKANLADSAGVQLIQLYEDEWFSRNEIVKSKIRCLLGKCRRIMARKTVLRKLTVNEKNVFLDSTHIQGSSNSAVAYGLFYLGELVACMTFGKSRYNKNFDYELLRYSSARDTVVVGGAAKLLSYFRKNFAGSIISYADRRWSCGNLYKKLGFRLDGISKPSFSYFNLKNKSLHNRQKYQKYKLENMEGFDKQKTAYDIMQLNGFDRIWDAGQLRFVLD
jgi:hypothetical protein